MNDRNEIRFPASLLLLLYFTCPFAARQYLVAQETNGSIRGKIAIPPVTLPQRHHDLARYGSYGSEGPEKDSEKAFPSEVTNVVIYLDGPGLEKLPHESRKAVLDQKDATFIPHVLPITKGTTVQIVNQDRTYHNVFSLSSAKKFNIGRRPTGEEVPVTFDRTGIVQVFCDIHSHMSAFIVVLDTDVFTQPKADGTFILDGIPPGNYTLHVWHERFAAQPQTIIVKSGEPTTADVSLQ